MKFELPPLPYPKHALEPHLGRETLELHYEKHHQGYLRKLKGAIEGKPIAEKPLVDIIRQAEGDIFNNAAQVWNHTFYWESLSAEGGGKPEGAIAKAIEAGFGSYDKFRERFVEVATGQFGSGYVWLVRNPDDELDVISTADAENPLTLGATPLLGVDLWEHAYYLDYKNERGDYVETLLEQLVDWNRASTRFEG